MALRSVPFRSEVLTWDPDSLAEYFRKVSLALWWWGGWQCPWRAGQRLEGRVQADMRGVKDGSDCPPSRQPHPLNEDPADLSAPLSAPAMRLGGREALK